jgi:hypothetical protein
MPTNVNQLFRSDGYLTAKVSPTEVNSRFVAKPPT